MSTGMDRETLDMVLESLHDFAKQTLPPEVLLDFDHRDEMPIEIVREMCGLETAAVICLSTRATALKR